MGTFRQDPALTFDDVLLVPGYSEIHPNQVDLGTRLTKDIGLPHLLARIAALFRRVDAAGRDESAEDVIERGPLRLDSQRVSASWGGRRVDLTLTEFWMVHALARHPGHVKSREQLMGEARMVVDDSTVTSHVKRIRKKFLAVDAAFDRIESVYGMGYRWNAE